MMADVGLLLFPLTLGFWIGGGFLLVHSWGGFAGSVWRRFRGIFFVIYAANFAVFSFPRARRVEIDRRRGGKIPGGNIAEASLRVDLWVWHRPAAPLGFAGIIQDRLEKVALESCDTWQAAQ